VRRARRGAAGLRAGGPVTAAAAAGPQRARRAHRPRRLLEPRRAGVLGPGPVSRAPVTRRLVGWLDQRLGAAGFARTALNKVFPDHWSFMIGELALYCFTILVLTGVYLTFFFHPSPTEVVYQGSYGPLRGLPMSEAYRSAIQLSFDVRAGLVMRQIHHWAALLFLAS